MYKGIIFDLDGVIVDTVKYHFLAWKRLADELGVEFTQVDNELLKGVSRMRSLQIILDKGKITITNDEKENLASKKNKWYLEYLNHLRKDEILSGIEPLLAWLKKSGIKVSLGSASKNAKFILEKLELKDYFDSIVDGTNVSKAKPDPEVFLIAAQALGLNNTECIVVEDAAAGVEAAKKACMYVIGIGESDILSQADTCFDETQLACEHIKTLFSQ